MGTRKFFLVGLGLLAMSLCTLFILIFLSYWPMRSSPTIPLTSLPYCQGGCSGPGSTNDTIGDSDIGRLTIASEWPTQTDINNSDNISVLLTAPHSPGPNTFSKLGNHEIAKAIPDLPGKHLGPTINDTFGSGYEAFALAHLVTTTFNVQSVEPEEQAVNQPSIEWDWNISPKMLGMQVINLDIEVMWKPTNKSGGENIIRQIWQSRIVIKVDEPLIAVGQISVGAVATGLITFVCGVGLTVPWIFEQIEKKAKGRKRTRNEQTKIIIIKPQRLM